MRKRLALAVAVVVTVLSCVAVYALDSIPQESPVVITEAVIAGDVCEEHLLQDCSECAEIMPYATYAHYCTKCGKKMTLCCNNTKVRDDYNGTCNVDSHPDGCVNIQDWCRNIYVCSTCVIFESGTYDDDIHLESYYHTDCNCSTYCSNNAYCSLPRLSDLVPTSDGIELAAEQSVPSKTYASREEEAIVAGDYCEVHDLFACDIPHNDIDG